MVASMMSPPRRDGRSNCNLVESRTGFDSPTCVASDCGHNEKPDFKQKPCFSTSTKRLPICLVISARTNLLVANIILSRPPLYDNLLGFIFQRGERLAGSRCTARYKVS